MIEKGRHCLSLIPVRKQKDEIQILQVGTNSCAEQPLQISNAICLLTLYARIAMSEMYVIRLKYRFFKWCHIRRKTNKTINLLSINRQNKFKNFKVFLEQNLNKFEFICCLALWVFTEPEAGGALYAVGSCLTRWLIPKIFISLSEWMTWWSKCIAFTIVSLIEGRTKDMQTQNLHSIRGMVFFSIPPHGFLDAFFISDRSVILRKGHSSNISFLLLVFFFNFYVFWF